MSIYQLSDSIDVTDRGQTYFLFVFAADMLVTVVLCRFNSPLNILLSLSAV